METLLDKHWHHIPFEEVANLFNVKIENGLDLFEVERRFEHFGPNLIQGKESLTIIEIFFQQLNQPLVYILLIAGLVTLLLGEWVDSLVIMSVVAVNAVMGFIQEYRAFNTLESLKKTINMITSVVRSGKEVNVDASGLVPGDIVILRSGDKVPADLRLIAAKDLRIDEASMTGESVPVSKQSGATGHEAVLAERTSMAYAGTIVSYGQGRGIVVATGNRTELGRISSLIDSAQGIDTPLTQKIKKFSHIVLYAILGLAAASFLAGVIRDESVSEMFMVAVALAVGAIPEGLPAVVTVILAMAVSRMAKKRAIIRKLPAVETLGGTTVICSDKTGTLTENQMTTKNIYAGEFEYTVSGSGYSPVGGIEPDPGGGRHDPENNFALAACLEAGLLCNDAELIFDGERYEAQGDPTEAALLVSAAKMGFNRDLATAKAPRVDEIPFESDLQYMATLHSTEDGTVIYMKGAAEKVAENCSTAMTFAGDSKSLELNAVTEKLHSYASAGKRVLAFSRRLFPADKTIIMQDDLQDMEFLGLQGIIDPPREEAKKAIATCHNAGIDVKMITGDHAVTAQVIGEMLGLTAPDCTTDNCVVITGSEIEALSDRQLIEVVGDTSVFARVSPEQKLRLVMALQARKEVCAMTGDGVNDAPALKQADIGIAMGLGGTEAAKEASDMVLTDDNFATIEEAVEEGRCVFSNLLKFIAWTLPTNAGEGLVIMMAIIFGATLPILPVQILWINMTTAVCLGMMLAFEPREPGLMDKPPRGSEKPLLDRLILKRISMISILLLVSAFGLFELVLVSGGTEEKARTVAVNVFIIVEAFYLFNSRSFDKSPLELGLMSNPWVIIGFVASIALQMLYTYAPFMNDIFHSVPISFTDWMIIISCGVAGLLIVEADKKWEKNKARNP